MAITALLDASVLYPLPLRDTLLRAAQVGIYDPFWSERILDEVERNLVRNGVANATAAARMLDAMRDAFVTASVAQPEIARLEPTMTNDPKDRHVLAAAVAAEAEVIVTLNLRDFPRSACDPCRSSPFIRTTSCSSSTASTRAPSNSRFRCKPPRSPAQQ